jgi:hypothetical protein
MAREGGKLSAVSVIFGKTTKYGGRNCDKPFVMFIALFIYSEIFPNDQIIRLNLRNPPHHNPSHMALMLNVTDSHGGFFWS